MAPKAVLVGLPGSGKSTIGRRLAKALDVPLLDTDAAIEKSTGRRIADIFATDGEAEFRRIEESVIRDALAGHDGVAERAAAAGVPVVRTYGMSETAGGCVYDGIPLDGVGVRIDGDGRIWLGGPTVAAGYRNPVTPDPFTEPGWFRTDDLGAVDDSGALRVLGRVDDAITTGGLKVLPSVVEAALSTHPAVAECAVFGVADERLGQRVVAAVVTAAGASITLAQLRSHVAATLPSTAAPRQLHIVDELPLRGIGKVDRRALAGRFG
ncbi:shikimate kinase [Mycobacterium sp. NAZ190054]|uniref:shikimate kinase n=1 Tax=Mycobacterium sp. NAZ190054 TaxID=1747766 RepID=UPI0009EC9F8B